MDKKEKRTALITGGSRGIGRAVAIEFGKAGFNVVVNYVSNTRAAAEVAGEIEKSGGTAAAIQGDIGNYGQMCSLVEEAFRKFGQIDVLVNNAGVWRGGRINRISKSDWDYVIDTNLKGIYNCTQAVVPHMIDRRCGVIINITSIIGLIGFSGDTAYGAAKAGIIGFTKSLAKEVARYNITVNAVAPGIIATDMNAVLEKETRDQLANRIPLGRLGQPEEISRLVRFLVLEGSYITGQVIVVDGGYVLVK